jgi:predicted O-methyltransferase YrrM
MKSSQHPNPSREFAIPHGIEFSFTQAAPNGDPERTRANTCHLRSDIILTPATRVRQRGRLSQRLVHPTEADQLEELLKPLGPYFRTALLSMYRGEPQLGIDGQQHRIDNHTRISPSQGMWLYEFCLATGANSTLEIGMAYGYSTLFFLAAMASNGAGQHIAIDPYQRTDWQGIGLAHANASGIGTDPACGFRWIEDRSDRAATDLARSNSSFDLFFIDGFHRFDDVLVDFYLYAPLCKIGGHIVFDDLWLSSIQTATSFIRENRTDFAEQPIAGVPNVRVFQKVSADARPWSHFRSFSMGPATD